MQQSNGSATPEGWDFDLVSVVLVPNLKYLQGTITLGPEEIESIESSMGQTLRIGRASTERGDGVVLGIRPHQIDVLMVGDRIEVRCLQPSFSKDEADLMASFLLNVTRHLGEVTWRDLGYNFILNIRSDEVAIQKLGQRLLRDDLEDRFGHKIRGGAAWLWLDVGDSLLWLKLQPYRDVSTTDRIIVNANFGIRFVEKPQLPSEEEISQNLWSHWEQLGSILHAVEL